MRAIRIHQPGGPEVLELEEVPDPKPQAGEVLVRLSAIGVNFIDVYHRTGLYPLTPPFTPGSEGAGVVEAIGAGVTTVAPGDRVAWAMHGGSYAELAVVPAWKVVKIPAEVDFKRAAAAMLQGMTAHFLTHDTFPVRAGHTVLVHAAAGGVGLLLVQLAKRLGARVLATVSTEAKAALARDAGADHVILYTKEDFVAAARKATDGVGVDVIYDSVGQATFPAGIGALKVRGMVALFGQSSGRVAPFDVFALSAGSTFVTRPTLVHHARDPAEVGARAGAVLKLVEDGALKLRVERTYALADAGEAHADLEGRRTTGKLLLKP